MSLERQIEEQLIDKLQSLKYEYRQDIRDRDGLVKNFREKFRALNRVQLGDAEFERLLDEIITPDVFAAAKILRERNSFTREDGTPLNYTLVNIKDWCKNTFEVVNQIPYGQKRRSQAELFGRVLLRVQGRSRVKLLTSSIQAVRQTQYPKQGPPPAQAASRS